MSQQEQIKNAIAERRALGHTDEEIIAEFTAAGYTDEAARALVQPAQTVSSIPQSPEPVAPKDTPPAPTDTPSVESQSTKTKRTPWLRFVVLGVLALVALGLAIVVFAFRQEVSTWLRVQFGGAPYVSESALIEGAFAQAQTNRHIDLALTAGVKFLPADEIANPKNSPEMDETFAALEAFGFPVPEEGHARFSLSGTSDWRDEENLAADITMSLDVLMEPFILQMAADARTTNDRTFVRITDMPALLKQSMNGVPLEEWIEVDSGEGFTPPEIPIAPARFIFGPQTEELASYGASLRAVWDTTLQHLQYTTNSVLSGTQIALVMESNPPPPLSAEQQAAVRAQIIDSPIFVFVGEPETVSAAERTYFRYEFDIDYVHLTELITTLAELAETTDENDVAADMQTLLDEMTAEDIETVNRMTDMYLQVESNGMVSGLEMVSGIVPTDSPNGVEFRFQSTWQPITGEEAISIPDNVYEFTYEEIREQQRSTSGSESSSSTSRAQSDEVSFTRMSDTDHVRGNPDARVVLVEYCDFESPFCSRYHDTLQSLMSEYEETGDVAWVYRQFPLEPLHPNAMNLAVRAECVAEVAGEAAFWDFTDSVYAIKEDAEPLPLGAVDEIAAAVVGANFQSYETCQQTSEIAARVDAEMQSGVEAGARGTPYTFVYQSGSTEDPVVINGAQSLTSVRGVVQELLEEDRR